MQSATKHQAVARNVTAATQPVLHLTLPTGLALRACKGEVVRLAGLGGQSLPAARMAGVAVDGSRFVTYLLCAILAAIFLRVSRAGWP